MAVRRCDHTTDCQNSCVERLATYFSPTFQLLAQFTVGSAPNLLNEAAPIRLVACVLAEQHNERKVSRHYVSADSMALLERKEVEPTPMLAAS